MTDIRVAYAILSPSGDRISLNDIVVMPRSTRLCEAGGDPKRQPLRIGVVVGFRKKKERTWVIAQSNGNLWDILVEDVVLEENDNDKPF